MTKPQNRIDVNWYKNFLLETLEEAKHKDGIDLLSYLEERIRTLSNSDVVYLLKKDPTGGDKYIIPTTRKVLEPCRDKGIFGEMLQKKQPIFVKDVEESLLFVNSCDNLTKEKLKDVFLIPIFMDASKEELPPYLCWGATYAESEKRIEQKNILFILKFLESIKSYLSAIDSSIRSPEQDYIEQIEDLMRQKERMSLYFHNIIHDIRTPMNALMGFLELLSHNETDETKSNYISSAIKSAEQMVRLINDALDLAKIEKGELPIEKHPFNPTLELMESIRIFYEAAKKKGIQLSTFFDPSIPEQIVSDQYRIKQVLSNLLSNAIKFTPKNGSVFVETTYDKERDILRISVTDTGIGIDEEEKKYIFSPYRQANSKIQKEYGGTGLGLSVSQQIVSLLGGKLDFESEKGKGTTFTMEIPANTPEGAGPYLHLKKIPNTSIFLHNWAQRDDFRAGVVKRYLDIVEAKYTEGDKERKELANHNMLVVDKDYYYLEDNPFIQEFLDKGKRVIFLEDIFDTLSKQFDGDVVKLSLPIFSKDLYEAVDALADQQKEKEQEITERSYAGHRVVVVDDNKINLKVMEHILKRFDLDIVLFEDARSVVDYLNKEKADLLIIDENMPGLSGSEAIKMIREESKNSDIPIVSLTGDVYHKEEILAAGANSIILKPVKIDQIAKILKEYLEKPQLEEA